MQLIFLNFLTATFIWITLEASTRSEYSAQKCARIPPDNKVEIQSASAFCWILPSAYINGAGCDARRYEQLAEDENMKCLERIRE